ncbi:MAG: glycosyltransferase [Bacteroidetes bacterium]|jgi:cellulose synthase/poly-beta-1,6-N-acetylglucosamine synthase-like glycosyltransferase|nr:glycosyltransferase [Bacteroidota bacterium]
MDLATFILIVLALYLLQTAIVVVGLTRIPPITTGARPTVSIVVAARNEEASIGACVDALCRQTFPADRYEVIVVDDDSTDLTAEVVRGRMPDHVQLRLVHSSPLSRLKGKARPLSAGIAQARGEVILITDADCRVPPTWVEATAGQYEPDVGLVGGITLQRAHTSFGGMQSLDWAYLLGVAAASVALGRSFGSIGNNLSFRKRAYDEVGGYDSLPFSVTEDYTLVHAIRSSGRWQQRYPIDARLLVESDPCPDVRALFHQKLRWGRGGLDVPFIGFVIMAIGWSVHFLPLIHTLVWGAWWHTLTVLFVKATADYVLLAQVLKRLGRLDDLRHFFWFELYFALYVVALPVVVLLGGPVRWKGRQY